MFFQSHGHGLIQVYVEALGARHVQRLSQEVRQMLEEAEREVGKELLRSNDFCYVTGARLKGDEPFGLKEERRVPMPEGMPAAIIFSFTPKGDIPIDIHITEEGSTFSFRGDLVPLSRQELWKRRKEEVVELSKCEQGDYEAVLHRAAELHGWEWLATHNPVLGCLDEESLPSLLWTSGELVDVRMKD